jgi:WD40 repeat protein
VAAASDGRVFIGSDNFVNVHGLRSLRVKVHTAEVKAVATMPDGRFMTASNDCCKVWKRDGSLESIIAVDGRALSLAVMPDGAHFVVGISVRDDGIELPIGRVKLYDFAGSLIHTFTGHSRPVRALAVTRDGQHIISGAGVAPSSPERGGQYPERRVMVWHVAEKRLLHEYTWFRGTGGVYALAVMPDDKRFLSGGRDATVRVWLVDEDGDSLRGEIEVSKLGGRDGMSVMALVALPDNKHALCASRDGTVELFSVPSIDESKRSGTVLRTFKHHFWSQSPSNAVRSLALLPDGLRFVSGSNDGTARIAYHGLAPSP